MSEYGGGGNPDVLDARPQARFPGGGLDVPNTAVAGGSMYIFGGCASPYLPPTPSG